MSLQVAPTADVQARVRPGGLAVRLEEIPTAAWFEVWYAVHGHGGGPHLEWGMLRRVRPSSAYASVLDGGEVIAVGRAVADTGWAGVFGMATRPEARGRGAAGGILGALAGWAAARGANGIYLQAEGDNPAAVRLYDRTGFTELCSYHYRTRSPSPSSR